MPRYLNTKNYSYSYNTEHFFDEFESKNTIFYIEENDVIKEMVGLTFDGTDDVITSSISSINPNITVETLIKPETLPSDISNIIDLNEDGQEVYIRTDADNKIDFSVTTSNGTVSVKSNISLKEGNHYRISGVYDGKEIKLFIAENDGNFNLENSNVQTGNIAWSGAVTVTYGGLPSNNNVRFNFSMYDVRIWSNDLDSSVIKNNRYKRLNGNETSLELLWQLDSNFKSTFVADGSITDDTGNGNTGNLTGGSLELGKNTLVSKTVQKTIVSPGTIYISGDSSTSGHNYTLTDTQVGNRKMYIGLHHSNFTANTVTFGGVSATKLDEINTATGGNTREVQVWYINESELSALTKGQIYQVLVNGSEFTGGTSVVLLGNCKQEVDNYATNSTGDTDTFSGNVTSPDGNIVVDFGVKAGSGVDAVKGSNQTLIFQSVVATSRIGFSSYRDSTSPSTTMEWTSSDATDDWSHIIIDVEKVSNVSKEEVNVDSNGYSTIIIKNKNTSNDIKVYLNSENNDYFIVGSSSNVELEGLNYYNSYINKLIFVNESAENIDVELFYKVYDN